jgi:FtsZ-binding cell division protein ZapB
MTEQEQAGRWAELVEEAARAVQGDAGVLDGMELHTKLAEASRRNEELAAENAKLADDATQLRRELEDLEQQNIVLSTSIATWEKSLRASQGTHFDGPPRPKPSPFRGTFATPGHNGEFAEGESYDHLMCRLNKSPCFTCQL